MSQPIHVEWPLFTCLQSQGFVLASLNARLEQHFGGKKTVLESLRSTERPERILFTSRQWECACSACAEIRTLLQEHYSLEPSGLEFGLMRGVLISGLETFDELTPPPAKVSASVKSSGNFFTTGLLRLRNVMPSWTTLNVAKPRKL